MSASNRSNSLIHDHEEGVFDSSCNEERDAVRAALASYYLYRQAAHLTYTHRRRRNLYSLPVAQQDVLRSIGWLQNLEKVDEAIEANAHFAECLLRSGSHGFGVDWRDAEQWKELATPEDLDKARSTIKQFVRDWSEAGVVERNMTYGPILEAVDRLFGMTTPRCDVRVLVPGSGLGRLAFDLARKGYCTEGNEFSFHQLIASNFILNHTGAGEEFTIYPFCHTFSHHRSHADHLRPIQIPDIHPGRELSQYLEFTTQKDTYGHREGAPQTYRYKPSQFFSMSAGEFVASYNVPEAYESFDCVATCFFIDTARNLLNYMETIRNILREGGAWINHGPLLWHFEGSDATERKNPGDNRRKYGDLRGFDQVQADVEEAEKPQLPDFSDGISQQPSFGNSHSSRTRVDPGEHPEFTENGRSGATSPAGGEASVAISVESPFATSNAGSVRAASGSASVANEPLSTSASNRGNQNTRSAAPSNMGPYTHEGHSQHSHSHDDLDNWNGSLEFTLEDVIRLIDLYGFELLERKTTDPSGYINDVKSMGRYMYESEFWIAVKKRQVSDVVDKALKKFDIKDDTEDVNDAGSEEDAGGVRVEQGVLRFDNGGLQQSGEQHAGEGQ
ncbi:uncharacterized protein DFL_001543 [Arthrobotrys flagrans]|uniref:carnosine N-methyltransferase n=1 Tax=Arthrobotrys flagrans TaxID=97331 RepID=A0A437A833_ARTFL|nr:hypothetical protein DFL_001543 [Arthrobotrys flagrans]